jgi:hypothetical protein
LINADDQKRFKAEKIPHSPLKQQTEKNDASDDVEVKIIDFGSNFF